MSIIDKINLLNNPSLRTKLLAKFTKDSEREEVLQYIKKWQTTTLLLRVIASIFSLGLVPLIYLLWAKSHSQAHLNWVRKSTVDANDAMTKINSLHDEEEKGEEKQKEETDSESLPENKPKPTPQASEDKPEDTDSEHSVHIESIADEDDKITAQYKFGGKTYHGTQLGSLYIVNKGKVEQYHFKHLPIINIDITEITEGAKTLSVILLCYKNGSMDIYNLASFSQRLGLSCGNRFSLDPKNNTITFDQEGNLRAQLKPTDQCKDGKFIIIRKEFIFDHMLPPTQSQAALAAKERNKLTSRVQSSQSEEEESTLSSLSQ